ncbi:RES family NAD+ phosphorylase [Jiulongibacter sp. NS-SX5]|uniref:RES family NAD+ phosphorylase n=1 Tax=Jiulongibacter sp. NS-SX5 TaxID=3463854 RepID=UPI004057D11E
MIVHRITQSKYIDDLSGEGAKLYGGRWNALGISALYTAQYKSLALLELIVHFNSKAAFKKTYEFISLEIPSKYVYEIEAKNLPNNFTETNNQLLWKLTEPFYSQPNYLAMKVPSVLVSGEFNYVLNPRSRHFSKVKVSSKEPAFLDSRLIKA